MEKLIRDDRVAVLVSPGFGAGWYSWHRNEDLLFDPFIAETLIQCDEVFGETQINEITDYVTKTYGDDNYLGGLDQLAIVWLPVGTEFRIDEYDGAESLVVKEDEEWMIS